MFLTVVSDGLIPQGLEHDLAYIDKGHDILHDEVKKGMPLKDAVLSLKELYTTMDNWEQRFPTVRKEILEMTKNDIRELGFRTLQLTWNDWREKRSYAYLEGKRWRETNYALSDIVWALDARRARREAHAQRLEELAQQPTQPISLDKTQPIPVLEAAVVEVPLTTPAKKTVWQKIQTYLAPVSAAAVMLSIPLYKIVAKNPENIDYVLLGLMATPGYSMIRGRFDQKICG